MIKLTIHFKNGDELQATTSNLKYSDIKDMFEGSKLVTLATLSGNKIYFRNEDVLYFICGDKERT